MDFDALHAALGANEEASGRRVAKPDAPRVGESQGRSSATYASARPHTIPPSVVPSEDLAVPAVIVATEDTAPAPPPNVTVPLGTPPPAQAVAPPAAPHPSGPHVAVAVAPPSSQPNVPNVPNVPNLLDASPVQRAGPQLTMRMPERPRRPRSPTVVVRSRGPSPFQKLAAFMAMLMLVTACGIAVIIWRKPGWIGLEAAPSASAPRILAPLVSGAAATGATTTTATAGAMAGATTTASSAAGATTGTGSAAARPFWKKPAPPPHPSGR